MILLWRYREQWLVANPLIATRTRLVGNGWRFVVLILAPLQCEHHFFFLHSFFQVEWADGHCEPNFVNSWDVEVVENVHVFDDKCDEEAIDISTRIENGGSRKSTRK